MPRIIRYFSDRTTLSRAAADLFAASAQEAVRERGCFYVALSGGGTPGETYELLATESFQAQVPWAQTHVYWGDERLVPPDKPGSNYRQAYAKFLRHVPIPVENIHRALGELDSKTAVADYIAQLQYVQSVTEDGWPIFDLILLGLGSDGHAASLFPGPLPTEAEKQPVIGVMAEYDGRPAQRLTFTPPLLNTARQLLFLVAGPEKERALNAVLAGPYDPETWPAQRLRPQNGTVTWFVVTD